MCTVRKVEEAQLATLALEDAFGLEIEHRRDQAISWIEHQLVQRALRPGACCGGVLLERKLEDRMQLDALAALASVIEDITT
jgi:hypothetical protein